VQPVQPVQVSESKHQLVGKFQKMLLFVLVLVLDTAFCDTTTTSWYNVLLVL
jgi:hypothetical protein